MLTGLRWALIDHGYGVKVMKRLALITTCCVVALGTAAHAQVAPPPPISDVTGANSTTVSLGGNNVKNFTTSGSYSLSNVEGSTFATSVNNNIRARTISFEAGNAAIGQPVTSTSSASVSFLLTNTSGNPLAPTLNSTISAAGLGLYMADVGSCNFNGCAQTTSGKTFANLSPSSSQFIDVPPPLARVGFDFAVTAGSVGGDMTTVFDFSGSETISFDPTTGRETVNDITFNSPNILRGFEELQPGPTNSALGYAWDATNISVMLPSLESLGAENVVYTSTVTTESLGGCVTDDPTVCLVGYSSFGDPIGRGGGVSGTGGAMGGAAADALFSLAGFSLDGGQLGDPSGDPISGVNFGSAEFAYPVFNPDTGVVSLPGIPEPKTWMSLIVGFGLVGASLRRRRILSYS
jgi:hypothetical protein